MRNFLCVSTILVLLLSVCIQLHAYDKENKVTLHLSAITKIDGYYCKGWITKARSGHLISFDSAAPIQVKGGILPTGSRVVLFSNLKVQSVCLFKPTTIQGMSCIGYGPESPAMTFYPDGDLRTCYVTKNTWKQGILCHRGTFSRIILSPEGRLLSCELAQAQEIDGMMVKARSIIYMDERGKLTKVRKPNFLRSLFFDTLDKIM